MFTAPFCARGFSGLSKSPLTCPYAIHPLRHKGQQRPQGSSLSLQTTAIHLLSGGPKTTPSPRSETEVLCTSLHHFHMGICSNGNLDKGLIYSVVPCVADSVKHEGYPTLKRQRTHVPTSKPFNSVSGKNPSKMVLQVEIWASSYTGHLGHIQLTYWFLPLKYSIMIH